MKRKHTWGVGGIWPRTLLGVTESMDGYIAQYNTGNANILFMSPSRIFMTYLTVVMSTVQNPTELNHGVSGSE